MADKTGQTPIELRAKRALIAFHIGLAYAIVVSVCISVLTFSLLAVWIDITAARYGVKIDFGTSGILWIHTPIITFYITIFPIVLFLVNCIILPAFIFMDIHILYSRRLIYISIIMTLIEIFVLINGFFFTLGSMIDFDDWMNILFRYKSERQVLLMGFGPAVTILALSNYFLLGWLRQKTKS